LLGFEVGEKRTAEGGEEVATSKLFIAAPGPRLQRRLRTIEPSLEVLFDVLTVNSNRETVMLVLERLGELGGNLCTRVTEEVLALSAADADAGRVAAVLAEMN
jgi:hypothetical protein